MRKASKAVIALAVKKAQEKGVHVIVGWPAISSLREPAAVYLAGKAWPGRRTQREFRDIYCIVRPDGSWNELG